MASLYIKDPETAAMAERLSRRLNTTKTDAVRLALAALESSMPAPLSTAVIMEELDRWRAAHPLPAEAGPPADKAFFDRMWDDGD